MQIKIIPWIITGGTILVLGVFVGGYFLTKTREQKVPGTVATTSISVSNKTVSPLDATSISDVIPVNYLLNASLATTTSLEFERVKFAVPWSDVVKHRGVGSWNFKNGAYVFISVSTTTTKSTWSANSNIKKIFPIDSLSDYDLEKMIWESRTRDVSLLSVGKARNTDDVRSGMLATLKREKYVWCDQLLEFQNQNEIKGVICKWHNKGVPSVIVYFYPYSGAEYSLMFRTDQDSVMDSIVSSIRMK